MIKVKRKTKYLHLIANKIEDYTYHTQSDQTKDVIFSNVLDSIKHGVEQNKKEVELFLLAEGRSVVVLSKDRWQESLKSALKFYSSKSEFEKCIDCQELINLVV